MEPLIAAWGHAFTLIAPDSPGYGFSTPLTRAGAPVATATIDDFARATLELADALGLGRFAIYGYHTGASIGTALADAWPERVAAVAANGLVVQTPAERELILRDYLPPLVPRWDGGHLAWLWARMREQAIFFPWHDRRAGTRMDFDVPPADRLQAGLLEFLTAARHYHVAYRAAFEDRAELRLSRMRVPMLVTAAARDPLGAHLARIRTHSASVEVQPSSDAATALERCFAHLARNPAEAPPRQGPVGPPAGPADSAYAGVAGRQVRLLRLRATGRGAGVPTVVLLHPPGGSCLAQAPVAAALAAHADVLVPDLPGHGASDPPATGSALADTATRLAEALAPLLPADRPRILVALGEATPVARELATRLGPRTGLVLVAPPAWSATDRAEWLDTGLPPLTPVWYGGHLLEAWHLVRDGRLYTPWFRRNRSGIRPGEPDLDDDRIQRDVTDLLRANGTWQALLRDALRLGALPAGAAAVVELATLPADWAEVLGRAAGPAS
jgi:pimeloyl-ACP methyl ester carboxylesterase